LAVVVGVVALGLTLRYTINKPAPAKPKPPVQPAINLAPGTAENLTPVAPTVDLTAPTPVEPERAPEPPRIAGAVRIADEVIRSYGVGPGAIYYCEGHALMRQPKAGGDAERIADCEWQAHDLVADADGVFWCEQDKLMRVTSGATGAHVVAEIECIMQALDERYAYFVRPGFEGVEDPGVYRVERSGGTPERIHQRNKEQFGVHVDGEAIWISGYFLGTMARLAKSPGAVPRPVFSGQKNLEDFGMDATYLYWAVEGTNELRRRKKSGGPIEVVAKNVKSYPIEVVDGHVYWFERAESAWRLMHLAPGVQDSEVLANNLTTPSMKADAEGVYVAELDRPGVFMFKR
jgi:hypothetical protein